MAAVWRFYRNHWKKLTFGGAAVAFLGRYLNNQYQENLVRREFCDRAQEYGKQPLHCMGQTRKVVVFLNPAACKGQARKKFEKNAVPLLHLAGLEVTIIETDYEGHAKALASFPETLQRTDAVVVAGGDGTIMEVVTGILRRSDQFQTSKIPIGIIPLGRNNSLATSLFTSRESEVRWIAESAMAVIKELTCPVDVMRIQPLQDENSKPVFATLGIRWGAFRDAEQNLDKYWYMGPLKQRFAYIKRLMKDWPSEVSAVLSYNVQPVETVRMKDPEPEPDTSWWAWFWPWRSTQKIIIEPGEDPNEAVMPDSWDTERRVSAVEFTASTTNTTTSKEKCIVVSSSPKLSREDFVNLGDLSASTKTPPQDVPGHDWSKVQVDAFQLEPQIPEGKESWFSIDNEPYEVMPIKVKILPNKLRFFCNKEERLASSQPL
ncbi:hypothetical protein Bbelb_139080 [Branchiostoma belcheri]|nr:hypothetical protein Bbelb_139080 [Branchiostoma belcheri]